MAIVAAVLSVSDKRIAGNVGRVKPSKYKSLRRIAKRTKAPEKTVFHRQDLLHPAQKIISGVFTILVCGCLLLCLFKINNRIQNIVKILNRTDDLSLGGDEQFLEAVNTSPGIASIDLYWKDGVHIFEWESMEQSQVFQYIKSKQLYHTPLEYGMTMVFYEDVEAIKESLRTRDWEYYKTQYGLDIVHFKDDIRYTVSVGDVITFGPVSNYELIGTRALAEKSWLLREKN